MDITPIIPKGKKVITGYGDGGFSINNEKKSGNIIVTENDIFSWSGDINNINDLSRLQNLNIEILLLGLGLNHIILPESLRISLKKIASNIEVMTSGAACRTYNILLAEGRNVAAVLVAV